MKKIIVVTGGAGFVGSNMIDYLLLKTNYRIISLDNYSTGLKKNHIKDKRELNILNLILRIFQKNYQCLKKKLLHFFILGNFREYIKAF